MRSRPISRGFTLIELLVVIAIIGLLSSIVLASLNTARTKGQQAARLEDLHSLATALNLAAGPSGLPVIPEHEACLGGSGSCWGGAIGQSATLNAALAGTISNIPADPSGRTGIGDRFVYIDSVATPAYHCTGGSYPTGPAIYWEPISTSPNSDAACGNVGYYGCCDNIVGCSTGYYCIYPLN